jgi:ATP-binding cassette subfamily B protein RaxB
MLQTEEAECGLACLAMIGNFHGVDADLLSLRQRFGVSSQGTSLTTLMTIAEKLKLDSRALSLDINEVSELKLPCVLHWNHNHYVVLTEVKHAHFVIHDPGFGERVISYNEFSQNFTGVALEVWPASDFVTVKWRDKLKLRSLLKNVRGLPSALTKIFFLSLVIEAINLIFPVGIQLVMDHVVQASDRDLLTVICSGLLVLVLLRTGMMVLRSWTSVVMNALIDIQWKNGLFNHLLKLPVTYFEKRKLGDIQSRFGSLNTLRETFTSNIVSGIIDIIVAIGVLIMMVLYGGWLVWVVLGFTSLYTILRVSTYRLYRQANEEHVIKEAKAESHFMETLYGVTTLKSMGLASTRSRSWMNLNIDTVNAQIRISRLDMVFNSVSTLIATFDEILILWLGAAMVIDSKLTFGMFIAFNAYRTQFTERTNNLIDVVLQLRMLSLHNERVADIALTPPETEAAPRRIIPAVGPAKFEVTNLHYQYDDISQPILRGFNLSIAAGESVAIVGPSGVGKTTLLKILSGLVPPTEGTLKINDIDIQTAGINNYRHCIASVLQEDKLFSGTIAENIVGFESEIDEEHMIQCCKDSHIHEDIMSMAMGYYSLISELGGSLSGGQKQRLFIARALYRRPSILFMDEATSHLDVNNEARINEAIAALNITKVIVAHRQSTINSADRIIELKRDKFETK